MAPRIVETITEQDLLAEVAGLSRAELEICLGAGWVLPAEAGPGGARFLEIDVARLRLIHELRMDLGLDDEAVPVVLSLIDQLHDMRRRLICLADSLRTQPEEVRRPVLDALARRLGDL